MTWKPHLGHTPFAAAELAVAANVTGWWVRWWLNNPTAPCLIADTGETMLAAELEQASAFAAARLHRGGLRKGDRALISATTSFDLAVAHVACLRLGAVVVPVNTAYQRPELEHVVADAQPTVAIVDTLSWTEWLAPSLSQERVFSPADLRGGEAETSNARAENPSLALDRSLASDPALIGYTSGTTGKPKGAVLSHGNLVSGLRALQLAWRWQPGDRLLLALPLFHMHGLVVGLYGSLAAGAAALLLPSFSPDSLCGAAERHQATQFFGVPTMYQRLNQYGAISALTKLRLCVSGSAPLSADCHATFERLTGQRILERYGMTETLMLVSNPYEGERRPGTVGFPLPGVELKLDDAGEVLVRGPNVFGGYWHNEAATETAFDGAWFRTGDLGEYDSEGYLRLSGRARDLIISGGENIYPREVEDALLSHPAIAEVAVSGVPSEEWGEAVAAYLVLAKNSRAQDVSLAALRRHLAPQLAAFKHPRRVVVVGQLPRNALGKLQRHRLADLDA